MKRHRVVATLSVAGALIAAILFVPLPFHVDCTFDLAPRDAKSVFAGTTGRLQEVLVEPGETVQPGAILARMDNLDLKLAVARLRGEKARLEAQLKNLNRLKTEDERVDLQIPSVQEGLEMVMKQLAEKEAEMGRLEVVAPVAGVVFPAPARPQRDSEDGRLTPWSGSPFDGKNAGAILHGSDPICQIGDPQRFEAVLVIDQNDIDLVTAYEGIHDQWPRVEMKLDAYRWESIDGQISMVAFAPMENSPVSLSAQAGGELNTERDESGRVKPMSTSYPARVPLDHVERRLRVGLTGSAKIYTGWQPIGRRVARYVMRTFHFDL